MKKIQLAKYMKMPCLTEFQTEWIRKETARYLFVDKDRKCTCSRCNENVEVGHTKHRGKVTCPSCGKELQVIHLWRLWALDTIDWVAIPRALNETTLMLRYVISARHNESVTITELARMVIDLTTNKQYYFENINGEWVRSTRYYFREHPWGNIWGMRKLYCIPAIPYRQTWKRELNKLRNIKIRGNSEFDSKDWAPHYKVYMISRDANLYEKLEKVGLKDLAAEDKKRCERGYGDRIKYNGKETSLLRMLGITRTALRQLQERPTIETLEMVREHNFTPAEFATIKANNISKYDLRCLSEYGLKKTLAYIGKGVNVAAWNHYVGLLKRLEYKLTPEVLFPKNFEEADRKITAEYEEAERRKMAKADEKVNPKIKKIAEGLQKAPWLHEFFEGSSGLQVFVPETAEELRREGRKEHLDNCLKTYVNKVAEGKTLIFFVRRIEDPTASYVALEYRNGRVVQCMFKSNRVVTDTKIINFVEAMAAKLREHNILAA